MARFSNKAKNVTYEGGAANEKTLDQEWVNALCSSLLNGGYYESEETQTSRYIQLTHNMVKARGARFVAKAAVFSRNVLGMRSVSALTAAILNGYNFDGKREFYASYFHRPDDVAEVFGAIDKLGGKRSHALVRGACDYLSGLSDYSLGKYKLSGRSYNMYDLINLTHAHSAAISEYKNGTLPVPETWETLISAADPMEKGDVWACLVENHKLGYMALLRNLRNLALYVSKPCSWWEKHVVPQLTNATAIEKSLVFPYRIYTAYKELEDSESFSNAPMGVWACVKRALGSAFTLSVKNVSELSGDSLLVVDVSGSMCDTISPKSNVRLKEVGACYAAMLLLGGGFSDYVKFGNKALLFTPEDFSSENIFDLIQRMADNDGCGLGTCLDTVWPLVADKRYDRVFVVSDMQVMDGDGKTIDYGYWSPRYASCEYLSFDKYCAAIGETPKVYTFDLASYHEEPASFGSKVNYFTALSAETLKFISLLESGVSVCDYIDSEDWA